MDNKNKIIIDFIVRKQQNHIKNPESSPEEDDETVLVCYDLKQFISE